MFGTIPDEDLVFVIGCPGALKGPVSETIVEEWRSWSHISVGDEVRSYCEWRAEEDGAADDPVIKAKENSEMVPDEALVRILHDRIRELENTGYQSFIVDGLPRTIDQIDYIHEHFGQPGRVLFLDCPKEDAKKRVLDRDNEERPEAATEEHFEKRYAEFEANNPAIVEYYEALTPSGQLVKVDSGETSYDVDPEISSRLTVDNAKAALTDPELRPRLNVPDEALD